MKTEARTVPAFTTVSTSGAFDVVLTQGPVVSVELDGDDNILAEIETKVSGTTLDIRPVREISPTKTVLVRITHPGVEGVAIRGSGSIVASNLDVPRFQADISGSGNVKLAGKVTSVSVDVSGSGSVFTLGLAAENVRIEISGAGSAEVMATKSLVARISGSGTIVYAGDPTDVNTSVSGSGSVRRK